MTGDELKRWREGRELSREALAKLLGVTRHAVMNWENGRRKVPPFLYLALERLDQTLKGGRG